jgi:O-acetyl-ADP-ribose deacetylase (regulator of RNase III)
MNSFLHERVRIVVGDITRQDVDALVNAANSTLLGGAGVDGAIHRAGGAQILVECQEIRRTRYSQGLPTGEAVMTTGGRLSARFVIHTVGPIWGQHAGREAELLAACYRNSLALAVEHELASIAFPAISTGAYGYPPAEAAQVSSQAIRDFLSEAHEDATKLDDRRNMLEEVRLVFFSENAAKIFLRHQKFE